MGIVGYGHQTGIAWRYELTKEEQIALNINQKEYLASAINQKIQLKHDKSKHPCSKTSTCTVAWICKLNFDPDSHPMNNEIARKYTEDLL